MIPTAGAAAAGSSAAAARGEGVELKSFTDIHGVWAEYREAIANFPLPLPEGWSFPIESALRNPEPGVQWEIGSGDAEAYSYWQRAVATAAQEAHQRGDNAEADRLLDVLEAGYDTPTRRAVIEDVDNTLVAVAIGPARSANAATRGPLGGGISAH